MSSKSKLTSLRYFEQKKLLPSHRRHYTEQYSSRGVNWTSRVKTVEWPFKTWGRTQCFLNKLTSVQGIQHALDDCISLNIYRCTVSSSLLYWISSSPSVIRQFRTVDRAHSETRVCSHGGQHLTAALIWSTTSCSPMINQRDVQVWRRFGLSPRRDISPCPLLQPPQAAAAAAAASSAQQLILTVVKMCFLYCNCSPLYTDPDSLWF